MDQPQNNTVPVAPQPTTQNLPPAPVQTAMPMANEYGALPQVPIVGSPNDKILPELAPVLKSIRTVADMQKLPSEEYAAQDTSWFDSMGADTRIKMNQKVAGRDRYVELNTGELIPRFDTYHVGVDNEELAAQNQTTGEKWSRGLQKFGAKTGVNVLGGTIGIAGGLINAIQQQSFSAVYDTKFNKYLEDLNVKLDNNLANYYTEQEKDMNFFQQLGTSNLWSDKVLGGLAFLTGTIISEGLWAAATGGTSLIGKGVLSMGVRAATRVGAKSAATTMAAMKAGTKTLLRETAESEVKGLTKAAIAGSKWGEAAHTARFMYTSAGYEAGVETNQYMKETTSQWERDFKIQNGRDPEPFERANFNKGLRDNGNMLFAGNVALVGTSNTIILGKLLLNPAPARNISNNVFKKMLFGIGYAKKGTALVGAEANMAQKVFRKVAAIGKPVLTEGVIEEGGQAVMSGAAMDYTLSAYSTDANKENLSLVDALGKGFAHTYGTKEGLVEVGVGSIIGLFGGAVSSRGRFNEYSQEAKTLERDLTYVNQFTKENFIEVLKTSAKVAHFNKIGNEALVQGELTKAKSADTSAALAVIERGYHYQSTEELVKDFNTAMDAASNAELQAELGLNENEVNEWRDANKTEFAELVDTHVTNMEFADAYLGDAKIAGLDKIEGLDNHGVIDLKSSIAYTLTMGIKSDGYAQGLATQLKLFLSDKLDNTQAADAITVTDVLRKISTEKKQAFDRSSRLLSKAEQELRKAEVAIADAQTLVNDKEGNTTKADKLSKLNKLLLKHTETVAKLRQEKDSAIAALNLPLLTEELITEEMLDNQAENINKLQEVLDNNNLLNPQETAVVKNLIREYGTATSVYKDFNRLVEGIVNDKTRVNILNGWTSQIKNRKKEVDGDTAQLFVNMVKNYQDSVGTGGTAYRDDVFSSIEAAKKEAAKKTESNPLEEAPEDITAESKVEVPPATKSTVGNAMAADYLLTGGIGTILSTDYLLKGLAGMFTRAEISIEAIRNKYAKELSDNNLVDVKNFIGTETYNKIISEIRVALNTSYNNNSEIQKIFNEILKFPSGMPNRVGNQIESRYNTELQKLGGLPTEGIKQRAIAPITGVITILKAKINEIVNADSYTSALYNKKLDTSLDEVKPTKVEVDRYSELLAKINKGKNLNTILLKPYSKANKTGLTAEETAELKALNKKLGNWQVISGSNENDNSIAEVLELIKQLEDPNVATVVKDTIVAKELFKIKEGKDTKARRASNSLDGIVAPDVATAKKVKNNQSYELSHLSVLSLLRLFPNSKLVAVVKGVAKDISTIPAEILSEMTKTPGAQFILETEGGPMNIEVNERQRLVIDTATLEELMPNSNLKVLDFGHSNFMPLFEKDAEGNFIPVEGDFIIESIDENETIILDKSKLYELEPGATLRTVVNMNDSYNHKLLTDFRNGLITEEELTNSLHIYIMTEGAVNEIVGTLRAIHPSSNAKSETFAKIHMIRKQAVAKTLASTNARVEVGITVALREVRIGSPNLTVKEEDGGLVPSNITLTAEAVKGIEDFGYILDGKLFTNKNLEYSDKEATFARTVSGHPQNAGVKVPVVVFKYKNRTVVFPVSLIKSASTKGVTFANIMEDPNLSDIVKITKGNELLMESGIDPNRFRIYDLESEDSVEQLQLAYQALESIPDSTDVETWLEATYDKNNLANEVEIAIDITDKPFSAAKGMLDLQEVRLPNEEDMELTAVNVLDDLAKRVDLIFREKEPFKDERVESKFYTAFEDKGINMEADIYITKKNNANILISAFRESIPKGVKEALGVDLINQIKREIKHFEVLSKGLKVSKKAMEEDLAAELEYLENNCK